MASSNVLRVNGTEEKDCYREAVAQTLRRVQCEHEVTLLDIAERIDVSLGTISNAANKKTDLCATYLNRLAKRFGPHTLDPFAAMAGGRVIPLEPDDEADALPTITAAVHKLAVAQSPGSDGGVAVTHREMLDMEPEIDAAIRVLTSMKLRCSLIRSAA